MSAFLASFVSGCGSDSPASPRIEPRVTLPNADIAGWRRCIRQAFPDWEGEGDVTQRMAIEQKARAKRLDALKTACGERAVSWAESVSKEYGK